MTARKILIVDDDPDLREALQALCALPVQDAKGRAASAAGSGSSGAASGFDHGGNGDERGTGRQNPVADDGGFD